MIVFTIYPSSYCLQQFQRQWSMSIILRLQVISGIASLYYINTTYFKKKEMQTCNKPPPNLHVHHVLFIYSYIFIKWYDVIFLTKIKALLKFITRLVYVITGPSQRHFHGWQRHMWQWWCHWPRCNNTISGFWCCLLVLQDAKIAQKGHNRNTQHRKSNE